MTSKIFEIRNRGITILVLAVQLAPTCDAERRALGRAGYSYEAKTQREYIMLWPLEGGTATATTNPSHHRQFSQTLRAAHTHINRHFDALNTGAIIDAEYIDERPEPKHAEM